MVQTVFSNRSARDGFRLDPLVLEIPPVGNDAPGLVRLNAVSPALPSTQLSDPVPPSFVYIGAATVGENGTGSIRVYERHASSSSGGRAERSTPLSVDAEVIEIASPIFYQGSPAAEVTIIIEPHPTRVRIMRMSGSIKWPIDRRGMSYRPVLSNGEAVDTQPEVEPDAPSYSESRSVYTRQSPPETRTTYVDGAPVLGEWTSEISTPDYPLRLDSRIRVTVPGSPFVRTYDMQQAILPGGPAAVLSISPLGGAIRTR